MSAPQWLDRVSNDPLPVLSQSLRNLAELRGRPSLSGQRLAEIVDADLLLGIHVLRHANDEAERRQSIAKADTVSRAVLLLGVDRTVAITEGLRSVDALEDASRRARLVETLAEAHLAGCQARAWASAMNDPAPDAVQLAAALHYLGDLIACLHAEPAPARAGVAGDETSAFGVPAKELARALAVAWRLPALVRESLRAERGRDPRLAAVNLAVTLARGARLGWQHQTLRRCVAEAAALTRVEPHVASARIHAGAAEAARSFWQPSAMIAARALPLPPDDCFAPAGEETEPTSAAQTHARAGAQTAHPERAERDIVLDTLRRALQQMHQELGFERVVFAAVSSKHRALIGRLVRAPGDHQPAQRFHAELSGDDLFSRLMQRPQGVWMNEENRLRIWPLVPRRLHQFVSSASFCAMSMHLRGKPLGVFYADCPSSGPIDADAYTRFKRLCRRTARALEAARAAA